MAFPDFAELYRQATSSGAGLGPQQRLLNTAPFPGLNTPAPVAAPELTRGAKIMAFGKAAPGFLGRAVAGGAITAPLIEAGRDIYNRADLAKDGQFNPTPPQVSFAETAGGAATGVIQPRRIAPLGVPAVGSTTPLPAVAGPTNSSDRGEVANALNNPQQATAADFSAVQTADAARAGGTLRTVDSQVGRGGYGANGGYARVENINERVRGFGANPAALANLNEAQRLNRTGITGTRQADGSISFANDPNAQKKIYTGADGKPTTNWNDTEEYQSAIQRNAADKGALAAIEKQNQFSDLQDNVRKARTVTGKKVATDILNTAVQADVARENAQGVRATAGAQLQRQAMKDNTDTQLKLLELQATLGDKAAETKLKQYKAAGIETGKLDAAGNSLSPNYVFEPTLKPGEFFRGDKKSGTGALIQAKPATQIKMDPKTKKYYEVDGTRVVGESSKEEYERRNK